MKKDLNDDNFEKKYLIIDQFFKMTYIKDKKKFIKNNLYIGPGVINKSFAIDLTKLKV